MSLTSTTPPPDPGLNSDDRFSRQVLFPPIGLAGQHRLSLAHVAVVGVGATGAASASLLARAGVGRLTLIDRDFVEPSNLQRQILFDEADARDTLPKAVAARRKLLAINSTLHIDDHTADLTPANIHDLLGSAHLLLDATDNFETRYLLNDFAVQRGLPWIYAAAVGAYAATMTVLPRPANPSTPAPWQPTACLACLFPAPPTGPVETCDTAGILSTAVNLAASLQVTEALKFLTGDLASLRRTLVSFDLWPARSASDTSPAPSRLDHAEIASTPRQGCQTCDLRQFPHLAGTARPQITLCGRNSVQIHEHHRPLDLAALQQRLSTHPDVHGLRSNSLLLRFSRGPHTLTVFPDGRALIQGTTDPAVARALYARFIGS